jgi:dipeptidyl aminopeptidase/acylaminoacyl peptidase
MSSTTGRAITADDLYHIALVADPDVSPDGRRVAYTVSTLDREENRYRAALWVADLTGTRSARRLTSGRDRDGKPRWSPDGTFIAFTSDRNPDDKGKGQLWLLRVEGGEPQRLTELREAVEDFTWSPDSRCIAAISRVQHGTPNPDSDVRVIRTIRFRYDGEGYFDDKYRQLFVIDVGTGTAQQLTSGPFEHADPAWSPTGHEIAVRSNRDDGWELSPVRDIYVIRPGGTALRRVTDGTGSWSAPSWSPDGTTIACLGTKRLDSDAARTELFVVPAAGGAPVSLTREFDRSLRDGITADLVTFVQRPPLWNAAGTDLAVVYGDRGAAHVATVAVADGTVTTITSGRRRVGMLARLPHDGFVYAANDAVTPVELFTCDADGSNERRLTMHNDPWLAEVQLATPEEFTVHSADGTPVHGWLLRPPGAAPGARHPLLLEIHGGPFGMYGETLMHEFQLLAAQGYVVLYTNPRGSTGYGDEFAGLLCRGWGKHDFPDLMAAVDWAVAHEDVDAERLGVLGGSYGGFMTNWVIAHTDRFKAAVTQRTVSNMYSSFGTDDIFYASAHQTMGALPWEDPELYWELSPISYVDRIHTPLLIEHQEDDYRCPMEQAEQLFTALKRLRRTVEFVRYPEESHGMSRTGQPRHRIERLRFITDWFARYLQPEV